MRRPFSIVILLAFSAGCGDRGDESFGALAEFERVNATAIEAGQLVGEIDRSAGSASLVAILANPSAYQNQRVRTYGVLLVSPGDIGASGEAILFLSKEQMEHFIAPNALSLTLHPAYSVGDLVQMNGKYVIIEGLVDSAAKGHMGVMAGGLIDVNRIQSIGTER